MADISPDILEINVYGTQVVSIKQEKYYKEEIVPAEFVEGPERHLRSLPLVYTTRLDQMTTLKKIKRLTPKQATEKIITESKPQYKPIEKAIKQEYLPNSSFTSYIELCSNIHELNVKVKTEAYLRNEELLKMCKPLKIVLEDFRANKKILHSKILQEEKNHNDIINYSSDECSISDLSDDDFPLLKSIQPKPRSKKHYITTIAVKDKKSQQADIYVLEASKGVISYYRTNIYEFELLVRLHNSSKSVVLEYCCWVNREKRIKKLTGTGGFIRANLILYLKKPHNCLPRRCTCCCSSGTTMAKKSRNVEFVTYSHTNVTEAAAPVHNIINTACKPDTKISSVNPFIKPKIDYLKFAVIIIKYHFVIFTQTGLLGENYEIGQTGDINCYTKPTVNRSITEETDLYQNIDIEHNIVRKYIPFLICCWSKRDEILAQLRDCYNISPSALSYMRIPHLCRSDKCQCCCKPVPVQKLPLDNIATKNNIYCVSTDKQVLVKVPVNNKNIQIENIDTSLQYTGKNNNLPKKQAQKSNNDSNNPKVTKSTKQVSRKKIVGNKNIDLTAERSDKADQSNKKPKQKLNPKKANQPIPKYTDPEKTLSVINNCFDNFKDITLAVNEIGKLTANINAPPDQLTHADIKHLSNVLLFASKHIAEFGLSPYEFCNKINFSRALNGHRVSLTPDIVPTIDSSANDQVIINKNINQTSGAATKTPCNSSQDMAKKELACKSTPFIMLPLTPQNKNPICVTFQMMSSLSGIKNQHLVRAYKYHFKDLTTDCTPSAPVQQSTNDGLQKPSLAKAKQAGAAKVNAVIKNKIKNATARQPAVRTKRKTMPDEDQVRKKLCVKPPEEITNPNPLPEKNSQVPLSISQSIKNFDEIKDGTAKPPIQFYVCNTKLIPIPNKINPVGQPLVTAKMPEPILNGSPLLYKMLSNNSPSCPPALVPISTVPLAPPSLKPLDPLKMSVRSLIEAHSDQFKKKKTVQKKTAKKVIELTKTNPKDSTTDIDIESSLKTNVIQMPRPSGSTIKNAVNTNGHMEPISIMVLDDDEEEDGIFGV